MSADKATLLLQHYLKQLKLPSFLREFDKLAAVMSAPSLQPATEQADGGTAQAVGQRCCGLVRRAASAARHCLAVSGSLLRVY